ncbi:hypothetical protein DSECCO2_335060 [anaerobic digester metagenome]
MKFIFNTTDIIPLDFEKKKTVQKKLQRLANEEGNISESLNELFEIFRQNLKAFIDDERIANAIFYSILLVFNKYEVEVKNDGACIHRKHVYKWLIGNILLNTIVFAQHKYFSMFNIPVAGLIAPEEKYWWLPELDESRIEWPLGKAFKWIYTSLNINQTHFHCPDHNDLEKKGDFQYYRLNQNLENASEWQKGKRVPSLESLFQNLDDSLKAMASTQQEKHRRKIDEKTRVSFRIVLFIARISTVISKMLYENLGQDFLETVVDDFKRQDRRLRKNSRRLSHHVDKIRRSWGITKQSQMDRIWWENSQAFWEDFEASFIRNIPKIQAWAQEHANSEPGLLELRYLATHMDSFYAGQYFLQRRIAVNKWYPPRFFELHSRGLELKNTGTTTRECVENYGLELKKENLEQNLEWLANWSWGAYYYRQEKWDEAYPFFRSAFEQAKYSAGKHQYKLVNQFIEICAKNNKWRDFKRGVCWANYLGLEIRWLRGMDSTEDDMKFAYELMKKVIYPVL